MNRKLFFLVAVIFWSSIFYQNTFVAQTKSETVKVESQTPQPDKLPLIDKCPELSNHKDFIFTGQVKRILSYKKPKPSQTHFGYSEPQEDFEPKETIRFAVNKVYQGLREHDGEIKEITADVFVDAAHPAPTFKIGENYLVYATPRYHGKNSFSLEDNLILYSDAPTQLVSQAKDKIRLLENLPRVQTPYEMFGIDAKEFIALGGLINGKASRLVQPKYPEEAKAKKVSGRVWVAALVDETGTVVKTQTICADDESLIKVSEDAALRSTFAPVLISGKPVKAAGVVVYNFVGQ